MLFSKRKGFSPVKDAIQKEGMDDDLRNGLWNAVDICIWEKIKYRNYRDYDESFQNSNMYSLFQNYWQNYFIIPLDNLPAYMESAHGVVREYFFKCEWHEVYDFIEFTAQNCPDNLSGEYIKHCNKILEKELSPYRFVDSQLTDITCEEEIESIESAMNTSTKFSGMQNHLKTALGMLSDRKSPDFRNSVKESISAVESLCKSITNDDKATLGQALHKMEKEHGLHPAFKTALSSLYGYASNYGGIRHALHEEVSQISYTDAKFMLVLCSAFINYVLGKESEKS